MKKWLSLLLALAMMLALLAGCGRDKNNQADTQADPQPAQEQEGSTAPESSTAPEGSTAGDNTVTFDDAQQQAQGDNSVSAGGDTAPAGESGMSSRP